MHRLRGQTQAALRAATQESADARRHLSVLEARVQAKDAAIEQFSNSLIEDSLKKKMEQDLNSTLSTTVTQVRP